MGTKYQVKELKCTVCGNTFLGVTAKYCEVCRRKRKQKKYHTEKKVCPICHQEKRMYNNQIICRRCNNDIERKSQYERMRIREIQKKLLSRKDGEKLITIERCPNYKEESITCAICYPGSWKFKDCGRSKK